MADDQGDEVFTLPSILVTSCDSSFKEEELIRREYKGDIYPTVVSLAAMLTLAVNKKHPA